MDVGPGYRAALGLPGGMGSALLHQINASQAGHVSQIFRLEEGQGNDRDTLGEALVWVYDSNEFPFYQAEVYHQFHDDFMPGGNYPASYNSLKTDVLQACRIQPTGCLNDADEPLQGCSTPQPRGGQDGTLTAGGGSGGSGTGWDREGSDGPASGVRRCPLWVLAVFVSGAALTSLP